MLAQLDEKINVSLMSVLTGATEYIVHQSERLSNHSCLFDPCRNTTRTNSVWVYLWSFKNSVICLCTINKQYAAFSYRFNSNYVLMLLSSTQINTTVMQNQQIHVLVGFCCY